MLFVMNSKLTKVIGKDKENHITKIVNPMKKVNHMYILYIYICIYYIHVYIYICVYIIYCFLTVCLVQWLHEVALCQAPTRHLLIFKSSDRWKIYFSWSFLENLKLHGEFWRKFDWKDIQTIFLYVCLEVSKPKSKKNRWIELKIFQGCFKTKKKQKHMKSFIT